MALVTVTWCMVRFASRFVGRPRCGRRLRACRCSLLVGYAPNAGQTAHANEEASPRRTGRRVTSAALQIRYWECKAGSAIGGKTCVCVRRGDSYARVRRSRPEERLLSDCPVAFPEHCGEALSPDGGAKSDVQGREQSLQTPYSDGISIAIRGKLVIGHPEMHGQSAAHAHQHLALPLPAQDASRSFAGGHWEPTGRERH